MDRDVRPSEGEDTETQLEVREDVRETPGEKLGISGDIFWHVRLVYIDPLRKQRWVKLKCA